MSKYTIKYKTICPVCLKESEIKEEEFELLSKNSELINIYKICSECTEKGEVVSNHALINKTSPEATYEAPEGISETYYEEKI